MCSTRRVRKVGKRVKETEYRFDWVLQKRTGKLGVRTLCEAICISCFAQYKLCPKGGQLLLGVARPRLWAREAGVVSIWGTQGGTVPSKFWQRKTTFCSVTIVDKPRAVRA